jgi:uncharacterized membrane protein (DUF485 family)
VTKPAWSPTVETSERTAGREFMDPRGERQFMDPRGEGQFTGPRDEAGPDYDAIRNSPDFVRLRRRLRLFVFPMSLLFFFWYMTFALLSAYAHTFMSHKLVGEINTGTVLGLMQFASTLAIVMTYQRFARKRLDPQADRINELAGVRSK